MQRRAVTNLFSVVLVVIFSVFSCRCSKAQNITGEIDGTVIDKSGAAVAGAQVTVINASTGQVARTLVTNEAGNYTAPLLQVDEYNIKVTEDGFETSETDGIQLHVADTLTINFSLKVGQASESVTVTANANAPNVETTEGSTIIDKTEMHELAVSSNNFEQMLLLQPGVSYGGTDDLIPGTITSAGDSGNGAQLSINGLRPQQLSWLMDGSDIVNHSDTKQVSTFPSMDAIRELKVLRNSYGAQYGGGGSAQVLLTTESGGSSIHGSTYYSWGNGALNANSFTNEALSNPPVAKPPTRFNNFGYTIGGPVVLLRPEAGKRLFKPVRVPKTYFYFAQEFRRNLYYPNTTTTSYPQPAQAHGYFQNPVCIQYTYTATGGEQCATNGRAMYLDPSGPNASPYPNYNWWVPNGSNGSANYIDPISALYQKDFIVAAMKLAPQPNDAIDPNTLHYQMASPFSETMELFRLDHEFSDRLNGFLRYIFDPINMTTPCGLYTGGDCKPAVSQSRTYEYGEGILAHATFVATPTMLAEFGASFQPYLVSSFPFGAVVAKNSQDIANANIQLPFNNSTVRVPAISINGGDWTSVGNYHDLDHTFQAYENTTKQLRQHTLYFGVNYEHYFRTLNQGTNNAGTYTFSPGSSKPTINGVAYTISAFEQSFANFLIGSPTSFAQTAIDPKSRASASLYEAYLQDNWRILPRLTLNGGVRYSTYGQAYDRANTQGAFQPEAYDPRNAPAIGTNGKICTNATATGCSAVTPNPNYILPNQLNPSADSFNGIVQGGTPISPLGAASLYSTGVSRTPRLNFAPRAGFAWNVYGDGKTSLRGGYGIFFNQTPLNIIQNQSFANPYYNLKPNWNFLPIPMSNPAGGSPVGNTVLGVNGQVRNWKTAYTQSWSLVLQQQLARNSLFEIAYAGTNTQHLFGEEDLNQPLPGAYVQAGINATVTCPTGPPCPVTSSNGGPQLNQIRPYLGYGSIAYNSLRFFSAYNGLQSTLFLRLAKSSRVVANYTWSKAMTNSIGNNLNVDPQNRFDLHSEWGPSALDRRQMFVASFIYELPFFRSQTGILGKSLGGWETTGIFRAIAGTWGTVTQSSNDPAGQGIIGSNAQKRLDMNGNPNVGAPHTVKNYFNTSVFAQVNTAISGPRPGNERPGSIAEPGYQRWDINLLKNWELGESRRFQFGAQATNALNHVSYSALDESLNDTKFGQVTGAHDMRTIRLRAKFYF